MNLLDWFIYHSNHSDFKDLKKPENYSQPVLIQDEIDSNNTDDELDPLEGNLYEGARYNFPSANKPTDDIGVFKSQEAFATAMLKQQSYFIVEILQQMVITFHCTQCFPSSFLLDLVVWI